MIHVFLIEDRADYRNSIRNILNERSDLRCSGTYVSFEEARDHITDELPEIILLDIELPGLSGVEAAREIKMLSPKTEILMLTAFDNNDLIFRSLRNGASGYLLKSESPMNLLRQIDELIQGGAPMSMSIARKVAESFRGGQEKITLTEQQHLILIALCEGKSYQAIANEMFIERSTVKYHIHNIYEKLHVTNKVSAVLKARNTGLLD